MNERIKDPVGREASPIEGLRNVCRRLVEKLHALSNRLQGKHKKVLAYKPSEEGVDFRKFDAELDAVSQDVNRVMPFIHAAIKDAEKTLGRSLSQEERGAIIARFLPKQAGAGNESAENPFPFVEMKEVDPATGEIITVKEGHLAPGQNIFNEVVGT